MKGERVRVRESSDTADKAEARRLLQQRLGQIAEGRFVGPAADRVTFEDLAGMILTDYKVNGKKSLPDLEQKLRLHLRPFFGNQTAHGISTADVKAYIAKRQDEGAANAKINRELEALKRMFNLGLQAEKITRKPYIAKLAENNVRQGFFEPWQFEAVLAKLAECLRPPVQFAHITGWRFRSEVLTLTWPQVDFEAGTVRLEPGTTKNKEARVFPLTHELHALLEHQWQEHRTRYPECLLIFHDHGHPIVNYRKRWVKACQ
ncbi:MAG: tyrosine-type recombinase/integrase, partial [Candidatus Binatia bacterium]